MASLLVSTSTIPPVILHHMAHIHKEFTYNFPCINLIDAVLAADITEVATAATVVDAWGYSDTHNSQHPSPCDLRLSDVRRNFITFPALCPLHFAIVFCCTSREARKACLHGRGRMIMPTSE